MAVAGCFDYHRLRTEAAMGPRVWHISVILLSIGLFAPTHGRQTIDLNGEWALNYELSDDPRQRAPEAMGADDRGCCDPTGRYGGGGFGTAGRAGRLPGGRDPNRSVLNPEAVDRLRGAVSDQLTAPRRMTITQDDLRAEVLLTYDDGRYVRIVPDDKEHAGISATSRITRRASWENGALVVEVKLETGQKVVHRLESRLAGEQLVVTTRLEPRGSQDEIRLRRVYDAHDPR